MSVEVNDVVVCLGDKWMLVTALRDYDLDLDVHKTIVGVTANGVEQAISSDDIIRVVPSEELADISSLMFLRVFNKYREKEIAERIVLEIEAEANSGSRELAVKHIVKIGWEHKYNSNNLEHSLHMCASHYCDAQRDAVRYLPAQ